MLYQAKSAYPAHTRELDEDEDDKPLVCPDRIAVSEDEDDKPLVQPTSRKEIVEEKRESVEKSKVPAQVRRRKGPPVWQDPSTTLEQDVSGNSRERSEEGSIWSKNHDGEALSRIANKLSDGRNLRDIRMKHYHLSTSQFKKRTTHLNIPGRIYDFYQHVEKTCSSCNSTKPRPNRSRLSGLRADEFGELIFVDHAATNV